MSCRRNGTTGASQTNQLEWGQLRRKKEDRRKSKEQVNKRLEANKKQLLSCHPSRFACPICSILSRRRHTIQTESRTLCHTYVQYYRNWYFGIGCLIDKFIGFRLANGASFASPSSLRHPLGIGGRWIGSKFASGRREFTTSSTSLCYGPLIFSFNIHIRIFG